LRRKLLRGHGIGTVSQEILTTPVWRKPPVAPSCFGVGNRGRGGSGG